MVVVWGREGIGKTALAVKLAQQIQQQFDCVIWRSLRYSPPLQDLLANLIETLSQQQQINLPKTVNGRISTLIEYLRSHRCLLVLDDWETINGSDNLVGNYLQGYEQYEELLKRLIEASHQSCLLLITRTEPREITITKSNTLPIRSLNLRDLDSESAKKIFKDKGFSGSEHGLEDLIKFYGGNPLILQMVATTIKDELKISVAEFLETCTLIYSDIRNIFNRQFKGLSDLEKKLLYRLAIKKQPMTITELRIILPSGLTDALRSLLQRCLIENDQTLFTLQPTVMRYVLEIFPPDIGDS